MFPGLEVKADGDTDMIHSQILEEGKAFELGT
jgi:hypothetical protein